MVLHGFAHRISDLPMWTALLTLPNVLYFYVGQLLAPIGLSPFYDLGYADGGKLVNVVIPVFILLIMALGLWWWSRNAKWNLPLFLGAWFLLTIAPALAVSLVMSRYEAVHDRYTYLPSVAFAILLGYGWTVLFPEGQVQRRKVGLGVALVLFTVLGAATHRQSLYWENDESLFTRGFAVAPHNILAKLNLAAEMVKQRRFEAAFAVSEQAVTLDANSAPALSSAAEAAYYLGDYARAENYYVKALAIGPPHVDQFYYLGLAEIASGHYREGLDVLAKGQALFPDSPGYHSAMARGYAGLNDWPQAAQQYEEELMLYPGSPGAADGLADARAHLSATAGEKSNADLRPVSR
jgi:tetratricopeptide (TPR) repeat protein